MKGTKKINEGVYEKIIPVTLVREDEFIKTTATAEILRRDDLNGWTYTLTAKGAADMSIELAAHDDVYFTKKQIVEFLESDASRVWEYSRLLHCWCLSFRKF